MIEAVLAMNATSPARAARRVDVIAQMTSQVAPRESLLLVRRWKGRGRRQSFDS